MCSTVSTSPKTSTTVTHPLKPSLSVRPHSYLFGVLVFHHIGFWRISFLGAFFQTTLLFLLILIFHRVSNIRFATESVVLPSSQNSFLSNKLVYDHFHYLSCEVASGLSHILTSKGLFLILSSILSCAISGIAILSVCCISPVFICTVFLSAFTAL